MGVKLLLVEIPAKKSVQAELHRKDDLTALKT